MKDILNTTKKKVLGKIFLKARVTPAIQREAFGNIH